MANRFNGIQSSDDSKIESITKTIAHQKAPQFVKGLCEQAQLPSRGHIKNYFDMFPSVHLWREKFEETEHANDALIAQLNSNFRSIKEKEASTKTNLFPISRELLTATLQMVCNELYAQSSFKSAFKRLNDLQKLAEVLSTVKNLQSEQTETETEKDNYFLLLAIQLELLGTEKQLLYNNALAMEAFDWSLRMFALHRSRNSEEDAEVIYNPEDVEFKRAAVFLELGEEEKATNLFYGLKVRHLGHGGFAGIGNFWFFAGIGRCGF